MLRTLRVKNCLSFLYNTLLDFQVTEKAPPTNRYERSITEDSRISKVICIVGANASGKSNLLRAISFVKWFLLDSFEYKVDSEFSLQPFLLTDDLNHTSEVEVEFEVDTSIYRYHLTFLKNVVISESLRILEMNPQLEKRKFRLVFDRVLDAAMDSYVVKYGPTGSFGSAVAYLARTRKNASLISAAILSNHPETKALQQYWSNVIPKIKYSHNRTSSFHLITESTEFYQRNQEFKASMVNIMSQCDLGLVGLDIDKVTLPKRSGEDEEEEYYMPFGRHTGIGGKEYRMPFYKESGGTAQIYVLLSTLLPVLEKGGLVLIDELEADLHPKLLPELLELFVSSNLNKYGAQLIFTSHATPLLSSLDKYQVVIVEKGCDGVSAAKRLDQIDRVRHDDNYYAKYTAGVYGGLPKIARLEPRSEEVQTPT